MIRYHATFCVNLFVNSYRALVVSQNVNRSSQVQRENSPICVYNVKLIKF